MRTFVCGQKSALDLGPEPAHAQRGLGRVIDGIGQGVVGCGFTGYRFESCLFGVWNLPVGHPRIKNNILEEGLPVAKSIKSKPRVSVFPAGPQLQALDRSVPRRASTTKNL